MRPFHVSRSVDDGDDAAVDLRPRTHTRNFASLRRNFRDFLSTCPQRSHGLLDTKRGTRSFLIYPSPRPCTSTLPRSYRSQFFFSVSKLSRSGIKGTRLSMALFFGTSLCLLFAGTCDDGGRGTVINWRLCVIIYNTEEVIS